MDTNQAGTSYTTSSLPNNRYYARVRKRNSSGAVGRWTTTWINILSLPAAPTLVSPADDSYSADTTPSFDWSDPASVSTSNVDTAIDASSVGMIAGVAYTTLQSFQIGTTGRVRSLSFYLGATTGAPVGELRWSLYEDDTGEPGALIGTGTFTPTASAINTVTINAFDAMELTSATTYWLELAPDVAQTDGNAWSWEVSTSAYGSGTYGVTTDGVFSTNASFDCRFSLTALTGTEVQVDTWEFRYDNDGSFSAPTLVTGLLTSDYTFPAPIADQDIHWQARARNASGASAWSATRVLHVQQVPAAPIPTFPDNLRWIQDFRLVTLGFSWGSVPTADNYWIQVTTVSGDYTGAEVVVDDDTLTVNEYFPGVGELPPGTYYWQVAAGNETGWGSFSTEQSFVVTDTLKELISSRPNFRVGWFPEDADSLLVRATNPYVAEGRDLFTLNGSSGTNWANIGTNTYRHTSGSTILLTQASLMTIGKAYFLEWQMSNRTAGTITPEVPPSGAISANGTYSHSFIATSTGLDFLPSSDFDGDVTILQFKQIDIRPSTDFPAATGRLNVVTNGEFDADYGWTLGANVAITGGKLVYTAGSGNTTQAASLLIGKSYDLTYTISNYSAGSIVLKPGSTGTGTSRSADGTYTETVVCAGSTSIVLAATGFTGDIDNVSVVPTDGLLLLNGDGSSTTGWTAENAGVHTIVGGKHRIAYGGTVTPQIRQIALIVGRRYRIFGSANGDGTFAPVIRMGTTTVYTGSASTTPVSFDFELVATDANLRLRSSATSAGYSEFDQVTIHDINPLDGALSGATHNASAEAALGGHSLVFNAGTHAVAIGSAELNSIFTPEELWLLAFGKMDTGVPNDGSQRVIVRIAVDGSNEERLRKNATTTAGLLHTGNGNAFQHNQAHGDTLVPFMLDTVVDISGSEVNTGWNGTEFGSTAAPTVMGGNLSLTNTALGASSSGGTSPWDGEIYPVALLNEVPPDADRLGIAQAAEVA